MDAHLHALSIEEKLQLVEELWDSIVADQTSVQLTDAHRAELDLRLAELEADGDHGRDAAASLDAIRQRLSSCAFGSAIERSRTSTQRLVGTRPG